MNRIYFKASPHAADPRTVKITIIYFITSTSRAFRFGVWFWENKLMNWCWNGAESVKSSINNPSKMIQNPSQNDPRSIKMRPRNGFGAKSRSGRRALTPGVPPWRQKGRPGDRCWTPVDPEWFKNLTFEHRLAHKSSKNDLREGGRKKHENSMNNLCQNPSSLMPQNHVWRYTLRL